MTSDRQFILIEADEVMVKSVRSATTGKATTITVQLSVSDPYALPSLTRSFADVMRMQEIKAKAGGRK